MKILNCISLNYKQIKLDIRKSFAFDDNVKLKKHQIELENFYKHLLDSESCGLMAYTYPEHKMIHLNKKAREIYNISEDEIDFSINSSPTFTIPVPASSIIK